MATFLSVAAKFREMDPKRAGAIFKDELGKTAGRFVPGVQAAVLATPTHGTKHSGLRARIAAAAESFAYQDRDITRCGVQMNPYRMPEDERSLPSMMEGSTRWRHPVWGHDEVWVAQESHEFFDGPVKDFGPAIQQAADRAVDRIISELGR